jgi:hypothetical protein
VQPTWTVAARGPAVDGVEHSGWMQGAGLGSGQRPSSTVTHRSLRCEADLSSQTKLRPMTNVTVRKDRGVARCVFRHACKLGFEGIVIKRLGSRYRSGRSPDWLKMKNPACATVKRKAEKEWGKE